MTELNDDLPNNVRIAIKAAAPMPSAERVERIWDRLMAFHGSQAVQSKAAAGAGQAEKMFGRKRGFSGWGLRRWMGYVAAGFLVFAVFSVKQIILTIENTARKPKIYSTTVGQRASVTLADGSVAILAPQTTLTVNGRNIELAGEAVFTVTKHSGDPFIVKASGIETRVLGTTFGVRSYDKKVRVIVAEGRVNTGGVVLSIGDATTIDESGRINIEHDTNVGGLLGWTSGRLAFKSVPLSDVAKDLERWYGLQIDIQDSGLAAEPVTAEFNNSSAETVVNALAEVLHARYQRQGGKVTFTRIGS